MRSLATDLAVYAKIFLMFLSVGLVLVKSLCIGDHLKSLYQLFLLLILYIIYLFLSCCFYADRLSDALVYM